MRGDAQNSGMDHAGGGRRGVRRGLLSDSARHPLRRGVSVVRGRRDDLLPRPRVRGAAPRDDQDATPAQDDPRVGNRRRSVSRAGRPGIRTAASPDPAPALQPRRLPAGRPVAIRKGPAPSSKRRRPHISGRRCLSSPTWFTRRLLRGGSPCWESRSRRRSSTRIPSCTCASAATAWIDSSREWSRGGGRCKIRASMEPVR